MKKVLAVVMAFCLCFSLASCGEVDKKPAMEAQTRAVTAFNEVGALINENIDMVPQEQVDQMNSLSQSLTEYKTKLEDPNMKWTKEEVDLMVTNFDGVATLMQELKKGIEEVIAAAAAE